MEEEYLEHAYSIISKMQVQSTEEFQQAFNKRRKLDEDKEEESDSDHGMDGDGDENDDEAEAESALKKNNDETTERDSDYNGGFLFDPKHGIPVKTKLSKLSSNSSNTKSGEDKNEVTVLVVPTTEELNAQIQNPEHLLEIAILRKETRQLTEEKVSVAKQSLSLLDSHIERLDADLEKFERCV